MHTFPLRVPSSGFVGVVSSATLATNAPDYKLTPEKHNVYVPLQTVAHRQYWTNKRC